MDKTWIHHYDPETKETQKSAGKVQFLGQGGIILTDYLEAGNTDEVILFFIIDQIARTNYRKT